MTFNTLHKINKVFYFTTLALYLLVYFGMMFQIIMGIVQLIIGFTLLVRRDELSKSKKTKLIIYWILVIAVFLLIVINFKLKYVAGSLFCFFILPMAIATYFYFFTANINSESFLQAEWQNLAIFNYEVDSEVLEKYLPAGTEIDIWDNKCYVSLVGFMFKNTKVQGVKVPFHINFEEVNLRFYVKRFENGEWKRGVVFIKEIVPKSAITFIANTLYQEHYETQKMRHEIIENENTNTFIYQWKSDNKWNTIELETRNNLSEIEIDSEAEFITEHYFGYTKIDDETTFEYEVQHPRWEQFEVLNHNVDINFSETYGTDFEFLQNKKPTSVFLAKGSQITVQNKRKLQIIPVLEETYQSI
ncbi:YqjF family protein [[Flexibacter] sp. ATCC 35103]|uniref:YqjF family protein n=1 Tax=[Flexibacter] sp. ATCC 35103 TaxID=1937528 RepID=UPI0026C06DBD